MAESEPKKWTRDTNWRQGDVLPEAAVLHFGLANAIDSAATCIVVISHDCDLANEDLEVEPEAEVIVGRLVAKAEGNFSWGKAPRTLHAAYRRDGVSVVVELVTTTKHSLPKKVLAEFEPAPAFDLDSNGLAVLRSWLGGRYNRAAFPNAFVDRMKKLKVDERLARVGEKYGKHISFIYLDLEGASNLERQDGDPYRMTIVLVYAPGQDPAEAGDAVDEAAERLEESVRGRIDAHPTVLQLKACVPISEDDLPVSRARTLTQWRLEYMTLKAGDEQPGPVAI